MSLPESTAPAYRPRSRLAQTIAGVVMALCGGAMAWIAHGQAWERGAFSFYGAMLGPAFVVFGVALAAFGGYREERLARGESLDGLSGWALLTPRWKAAVVLALVAGGAYTLALRQGWIP